MEFLTSAQEELSQSSLEIGYRNVTSGAYYSALHLCQTVLEPTNKISFPQENIILSLKQHPDKHLRVLSKVLQQIKDARVHADYRDDKHFPAIEARRIVAMVMKISQKITYFSKPR
jgi:uncharacterized protein (UPF0332 family)